MLQHGAYTLLMDSCYDRERFPTMEEAIDWTWASTQAEVEAVQFVLSKFFVLENGIYVQKHIQEELELYRKKSETNKRIAIERETKRKGTVTNRAHIVHDEETNRHLTNNQEPLTIIKEPHTPKGARKKREAISFQKYLEDCKTAGVKPIPDDDSVFDYTQKAGIPDDFLHLHYREFKSRYTQPDAKKYKDWRAVLRKSVQGNWFRLWYAGPEGGYVLSTQGIQAKTFHENSKK